MSYRWSSDSVIASPTRPASRKSSAAPYTTNAGKDVHVRVRRVDNDEVTMIRSWGAHERVAVRRPAEGQKS